jgi:hypothetical protein
MIEQSICQDMQILVCMKRKRTARERENEKDGLIKESR